MEHRVQSIAVFTIGNLFLKLYQMTSNIFSSSVIPPSEIYADNNSWLPRIASLEEHYNTIQTRKNKDNVEESPLLLDHTSVSHTIIRVG